MPITVKAKGNESADSVIRRFKKKVIQDQVLTELRRREFYKKPSTLKKEKLNEVKRKRILKAKYA